MSFFKTVGFFASLPALFCLFIPLLSQAQHENKNWYFGTGTDGIVFDAANNPVKVSNKFPGVGYEGMVVVSDPFTGELLFYSDGIDVINRNHAIMSNGTGLLSHYSGSQCVQVCRVPNTCHQYYIVSNSAFDNVPGSYYYSIVDFTSNPLGTVTVKNQFINGPGYHQAMCIVPKANSNNYWLIGHLYQTATYHVFEVTPGGFTGPSVYTFSNSGRSWAMKFNKATHKLINLGEDDIDVTMLDFNPATGVLSNEIQLAQPPIQNAWVGNFSPDGSKIYAGVTPGYELWQYDMSNGLWTDMNTCCYSHDVLTGPNGITYFIRSYNIADPLSQITNANLTAVGNACGYMQITNPGNFNGEVRRFPEFLVSVPPPVANLDTLTVAPGASPFINALNNDSDPQNDPITIDSILSGPLYGTATIANNQIQYSNTYSSCSNLVDSILYRITDSNCAYDTAFIVIYIEDAYPEAQFITNTDTCTHTVIFNNLSVNATSFIWQFGDGSNSTLVNPSHIYANPGLYSITLVAINGVCSDTMVYMITIPDDTVTSSFVFQLDSCTKTVNFYNTSVNSSSWQWQFGNGGGSNQQHPQVTYMTAGTYTVSLVASNTCKTDTSISIITVPDIPSPVSQFNYATDPCLTSVTLQNLSVNADSCLWLLGDGYSTTILNPSHTYVSAGTYTITLVTYNACATDTLQQSVPVTTAVRGTASFSFQTDACSNLVSFINTSTSATGFLWDFGNGMTDTLESPVYFYPAPGIYTVTLIITDSCGTDSVSQIIDLSGNNQPLADFTYGNQWCKEAAIPFINQSTFSLSYLWDFGDGTTDTVFHPTHLFPASGTYTVTLIGYNGCGSDTSQQQVVIAPPGLLQAGFTWSADSCFPLVHFTNTSLHDSLVSWQFGDGTSSMDLNPSHQYNFAGSFQVQLVVTGNTGCTDTSSQMVHLITHPVGYLFIPNCFTPNHDGHNDRFEIYAPYHCGEFRLQIYNRWGMLVFQNNNVAAFWDGTYDGRDCQEGIYVYRIETDGGIRSGIVSIMR